MSDESRSVQRRKAIMRGEPMPTFLSDPTARGPIREALAPEELAALTALTAGDVDANTASTLRTLFDDAVAYEDVRVAVRAALSDSTPSAPTLGDEEQAIRRLVEWPGPNWSDVNSTVLLDYLRHLLGIIDGLRAARLHETSQP